MTTTPTIGKDDEYDFTPGSRPAWNLVQRLLQHVDGPGVYPVTVIVTKDGRWQVVVVPGKVEELG